MGTTHSRAHRFWLGGKRDAEQDRFFREALESQGWEAGDEHDWDAGWVTGMPDPAQFRRVSPRRKLNHFPGNAALTIKSRLHDSLARMRDRVHESHGAGHELAARLAFFPRAYVMPHDYHALQEAALANPDQRWILKPTNASKGKGVRLLGDVGQAPLAPDWLVQEYLANPHTIRGRKYVLRLYVLITSIEPLRVYLYRQGFAKLASEPWDPDDADNPYSQLTNPDINALNDRAEVPVEFIDLDHYRQWLREQGHDDARLFARLHDLAALTAIAGVDAMRQRTAQVGADTRGCYELLGLDCLVDDTLKPWILECNLSPSLGICAGPESGGRMEAAIKGGLVRDLVSLVDIPGSLSASETPAEGEPWLADSEAELARAGDFQRLLPTADPARYLPYFSLPTLADLQLADAQAGRPAPRPLLQPRRVTELFEDDRLALYATDSGHYYRPNDTAAMIWLLATEGLDPDAIARELACAAAAEGGSPPEPGALRQEVWATLGEWCRAGLLCQRGSGEGATAQATRPGASGDVAPLATSGHAMQLAVHGGRWALHVAGAPALFRLTAFFGDVLTPLRDADAHELPRLAVLREPSGYTLSSRDAVLASRLSLAQLGPALATWLLRQAAKPDHLVIDAGLLVTPQDVGVLCLFPDGALHEDAIRQRVTAAGTLTRGLRLNMTSLAVEPLGLPVPGSAVEVSSVPPEALEVRGVLWMRPGESTDLAPASPLDVLGALLPGCHAAAGGALEASQVTTLVDWLGRCERRVGEFEDEGFLPASVSPWLASLGEPGEVSARTGTAVAEG